MKKVFILFIKAVVVQVRMKLSCGEGVPCHSELLSCFPLFSENSSRTVWEASGRASNITDSDLLAEEQLLNSICEKFGVLAYESPQGNLCRSAC